MPDPSHVTAAERVANLAPVVGTSRFKYSEAVLGEYLKEIMQFWRGEREPVGVDIEDSNRCK
jgi:exonuclease V